MPEALFPCSTCHEYKPLDAFIKAKHQRLLQGFPQQCKACKRVTHHAWYATHREEVILKVRLWTQDNAEYAQQRRHEHYRENKGRWKARAIRDREKINAQQRARMAQPENKLRKREKDRQSYAKHKASRLDWQKRYSQEHAPVIRARVKAWRQANPQQRRNQNIIRKARKNGAARTTLSAAQWREIKAAFDHRCAYCGRKMQRLTQDHITPCVEKGDHHLHNVVPACQSCNSRKGIGPPLKPVQPLLLTLAPEHKKKKVS